MLNVELIKSSMTRRGLSGVALGIACGVSKEAVSNWLNGESIPRPNKLAVLAKELGIDAEELLIPDPRAPVEPIVAFRMRGNKPPTAEAREAGEEVGRHLRQLLPFMGPQFSPRHIERPTLDEAFIDEVASTIRKRLGLSPIEQVSHSHLVALLREFGACLVPVYWGGDKVGHENAMSVYLPDTKSSWVLFNVGCRLDDFSYWLAHEFGHCLTLHTLTGDEGEEFAELFARALLFPKELARKALEDIRSTEAGERMNLVRWYAAKFGVSMVTVMRLADKVARLDGVEPTGLESPDFYAEWKKDETSALTASDEVFGTKKPSMSDLVVKGEAVFGTPIFRALARWQKSEGGRSPAFVAASLNLKLGDAVELANALQSLQD